MDWLLGQRLTPQERLRKNQRAIQKAQRELERERERLDREEKRMIVEMKKSAKQGQVNAVKIMAKDVVRTRRYKEKFAQMKTQLQAVSLRMQVFSHIL